METTAQLKAQTARNGLQNPLISNTVDKSCEPVVITRHHRLFVLGRVAIVCALLSGASYSALLAQSDSPPLPRLAVHFFQESGVAAISVDGKRIPVPKKTIQDGGPLESPLVNLTLEPGGAAVIVGAKAHEAIIDAQGFAGWAARVPRGNQLALAVDFKKVLIDMSAPESNKEAVTMRFADGAKAEMQKDSKCRFDLMPDQSYYVAGQGDILTENADGKQMNLSPYRLPMTGGPLVREETPDGQGRMKRLHPMVSVNFSGELNSEIVLEHDKTEIKLPVNAKRRFTAPNGQVLEMANASTSTTFDWKVTKGYFQFHNDAIPCWHGYGLTDQAAGMQWESSTATIDLANRTAFGVHQPVQPILTILGPNMSANIMPGSTFQYHQIDPCKTFAGAATGKTYLHNSDRNQTTSLEQGNLIMKGGIPMRAASAGSKPQLSLGWELNAPLELRTPDGLSVVQPDSKKQINLPQSGGQIDVAYDNKASILIRAEVGEYTVVPKAVGNWTFELGEGDAVSMSLDRRSGLFVVSTPADNSGPVSVSSSGGLMSPIMTPGSTLTFIIEPGLSPPGVTAPIIIFESAGSGTAPSTVPSGVGPSPIPPTTGYVDISTLPPVTTIPRVPQPPASIVD